MQQTAGYSGTPLVQKLGIKAGAEVLLVNPPGDYPELVQPLPEGATIVSSISARTDVVHVFSVRKAELGSTLRGLRPKLKPTAMVWVSWPKKAANVPTDITESTIREVALPLGYVDIKVCAIDAVWSGLKLVIRKELR